MVVALQGRHQASSPSLDLPRCLQGLPAPIYYCPQGPLCHPGLGVGRSQWWQPVHGSLNRDWASKSGLTCTWPRSLCEMG